jgi:Skp family chaperone for outer membrane proteins
MTERRRIGAPMTPRKTTLIKAAMPFGLILGIAAGARAQEAAPAGKKLVRPALIAVINMSQVSSESLLGKSYAAKIEALDNEIKAEGAKKQTDLQEKDTEIQALKEELQKQANVLSREAADKRAQDIRRKERDRQAFLEDGQAEIQRMQERARQQAQNLNNEFQLKIRPHIESVAKEWEVDILLDSSVALAVSQDFDISSDVVAKADAAERAQAPAPASEPEPQS